MNPQITLQTPSGVTLELVAYSPADRYSPESEARLQYAVRMVINNCEVAVLYCFESTQVFNGALMIDSAQIVLLASSIEPARQFLQQTKHLWEGA